MNKYETENKSLINEHVKQQINQARRPTVEVSCTYNLNKLPKTDIIVFLLHHIFQSTFVMGKKKRLKHFKDTMYVPFNVSSSRGQRESSEASFSGLTFGLCAAGKI